MIILVWVVVFVLFLVVMVLVMVGVGVSGGELYLRFKWYLVFIDDWFFWFLIIGSF